MNHAALNRSYRLVWSRVNNCWVAVAETAKGRGKSSARIKRTIAVLSLAPSLALAGLEGASIVGGQGAIVNPNLVQQDSARLAIHAQGFGVGAGESFTLRQQYISDVALIRVLGQNPSDILGSINAKGQLFISNPNGILFGPESQINVGGLVGTSLDISREDFMAGKINFHNSGSAGSVINQGKLSAADGGYIALLAPQVRNEGVIRATLGTVALAAGNKVTFNLDGASLLNFTIDKGTHNALIENKHYIEANGGQVFMSAQAADALTGAVVNNTGVVRAQRVHDQGGFIKITGDPQNSTINIHGTLDASAPEGGTGGRVEVTADNINVASNATITTRAHTGIVRAHNVVNEGGVIKLIGNMQTGNVNLAGKLDASAADAGKGGFIETSAAHVKVADSAQVSTLADGGQNGLWLIDPNDFTIAATGGDMTGAAVSAALAGGNFQIQTTLMGTAGGNGDIFVNDTVNWGANNLTLNAERNIYINQTLNGSGTASLTLLYGQASASGGATDNYFINTLGGAQVNLATGYNFSTQKGTAGVLRNYYVINDLGAEGSLSGVDLQGINGNLSGNYALGSNIDASITNTWNAGAGFNPIGTAATDFTGNFDGLGHTINDLFINRPTTDYVGLFGSVTGGNSLNPNQSGLIQNIGLVNGSVSGNEWVGALAGYVGFATVNNSYNLGVTVAGKQDGTSGGVIGGLIGDIDGAGALVMNSYSTGAVSGDYAVGGLVGYAEGGASIDASFATGNVTASNSGGGLAGASDGNISNSYATGNVSWNNLSFGSAFGGLVGESSGNGQRSGNYALGNVTGNRYVGGLLGYSDALSVSNNYATGNVTGTDYVGGLVGADFVSATYTNNYASGQVSGSTSVGGFLGLDGAGANTFNDNFWNTTTSTLSFGVANANVTGVTGKTTAEMQDVNTFSNWNISSTGGSNAIWRIYQGSTAPLLRSFLAPLAITANDVSLEYTGQPYSGGGGVWFEQDGITYTANNFAELVTTFPDVFGSLSFTGTSQGAVNVGTYTITPDGMHFIQNTGHIRLVQNYDVQLISGALDITPAPLTITADNATKYYGQTLNLDGTEFTSVGLKNYETIGSTTLTSAGLTSLAPTGNYPINISNATGGSFNPSNYIITYVPGVLDVLALPGGPVTPPAPPLTPEFIYAAEGATQTNASGFCSANNLVGREAFVRTWNDRLVLTEAATFELDSADTVADTKPLKLRNECTSCGELVRSFQDSPVVLVDGGVRLPDNRLGGPHGEEIFEINKIPRTIRARSAL